MTETTSPEPWQTAAVAEMNQERQPTLRVSSSGRCERSLVYTAAQAPESDPPDENSRNVMALGHMAEVLIINALHERGWETKHTVLHPGGQLEVKIKIPGAGRTITGHPDGICRHPELTRNRWVTLECKSMSYTKGIEVEERGIAQIYPHYIAQIALYARQLYEQELVVNPERGVFACMTRDGRILPPERVSWPKEEYDRTMAKLGGVVRNAREGVIPDRPYPSNSAECKYCNYHTLCWGKPPTGEELRHAPYARAVIDDDEEVMEAARIWRELKPEVDRARDTLIQASRNAGNIDVESEGVIGGYFTPRGEPALDYDLLRRKVPADILRECATKDQPAPEHRFWIRLKRG